MKILRKNCFSPQWPMVRVFNFFYYMYCIFPTINDKDVILYQGFKLYMCLFLVAGDMYRCSGPTYCIYIYRIAKMQEIILIQFHFMPLLFGSVGSCCCKKHLQF